MKKINFKKFRIFTDITQENSVETDVTKDLADVIYKTANGIMAHDVAFRVYRSEGEIELSDDEVAFLTKFLEGGTPLFRDSFIANLK